MVLSSLVLHAGYKERPSRCCCFTSYHPKFGLSYQGRHPPQQLAAMVARSNVLYDDATLFVESGANQHIPPGITNLTNSEPYNGEEKVAIVNGQTHRAHTTIRTK